MSASYFAGDIILRLRIMKKRTYWLLQYKYTGDEIQDIQRESVIQQEEDSFATEFYLNLRKKLVKCCIWSIALYGAETWTLRKLDQKYLESLEMWW